MKTLLILTVLLSAIPASANRVLQGNSGGGNTCKVNGSTFSCASQTVICAYEGSGSTMTCGARPSAFTANDLGGPTKCAVCVSGMIQIGEYVGGK